MEQIRNYKRQQRAVPQEVKDKISATLKGRTITPEWRAKISAGQKRAWATIPYTLKNNGENTNENGKEN
jgi:hypothetical protein